MFFCKYNDPIYVKMEKLEIMIKLASEKNIDQVLLEFKEYAQEVDVDFVRKVRLRRPWPGPGRLLRSAAAAGFPAAGAAGGSAHTEADRWGRLLRRRVTRRPPRRALSLRRRCARLAVAP